MTKFIPVVPKAGKPQVKINALMMAKVTALLIDGGLSRKDLAEETGLHYVSVLRYCRALRKEGILYIADWLPDARGRKAIPAYKLGRRPDVPKAKKSAEQISKDYRARLKMKELIQRTAGSL